MPDDSDKPSRFGVIRLAVSIAVCVLLVLAAGGASYVIFSSEPTAKREAATRRTAALVETVGAVRGDHRPVLQVLGVVEPARNMLLAPRVGGQIIAVQPSFTPGGIVEEGDELLRIDPADFERVLAVRESEVRQVEAELAIEQGRQQAARHEFELLGEEIDPANRSLVLREPQIESIRARLDAARSAREQAELDLSRTRIAAPFDAQILTKSADLGSQVAAGDPLARLVGIDEYWITASVPLRDLRWLRFPDDEQPGATARVRLATAWEPGESREGRLSRLIGEVDQQTRLARVLVVVPDPLARRSELPPLLLGTVVQVRIEGRVIESVIRIEREFLRQNDTVWVMSDGALEIRSVDVIYSDGDHAYISAGIDEGEQIVTTNLATVSPGLSLRRAGDATSPRGDGGAPGQGGASPP